MINTTGTVIGTDNLPSFVCGPSNPISETTQAISVIPIDPAIPNVSLLELKNVENPIQTNTDGLWADNTQDFQLLKFIDEKLAAGSTNLYAEALEQMERQLIAKILEVAGGNQSKTAEILGITRGKVRDRIAIFGIQLERTVTVGKQ